MIPLAVEPHPMKKGSRNPSWCSARQNRRHDDPKSCYRGTAGALLASLTALPHRRRPHHARSEVRPADVDVVADDPAKRIPAGRIDGPLERQCHAVRHGTRHAHGHAAEAAVVDHSRDNLDRRQPGVEVAAGRAWDWSRTPPTSHGNLVFLSGLDRSWSFMHSNARRDAAVWRSPGCVRAPGARGGSRPKSSRPRAARSYGPGSRRASRSRIATVSSYNARALCGLSPTHNTPSLPNCDNAPSRWNTTPCWLAP